MLNNRMKVTSAESGLVSRIFGGILLLAVILIVTGNTPIDASDRNRSTKKLFDLDSPQYRGYPKRFVGWGEIHRIGSNDIVIDDKQYNFAPRVTYHTTRSSNVSKSHFSVGQVVGFITDSSGEIKSLWQLVLER